MFEEGQPLLRQDLLGGRKLLLVGIESQGADRFQLDRCPQELRLARLVNVDLGHHGARLRKDLNEPFLLQL